MIREALPPRLRETAYLLACEVAAADGEATQGELRFLQDFRIAMDIDRLIAGAIERAATASYQVVCPAPVRPPRSRAAAPPACACRPAPRNRSRRRASPPA